MPSESGPQHRAMEAAKSGNSTLGIPKKVGAEFVAADKKAGKKFSPVKAKATAAALRKKPGAGDGRGMEGTEGAEGGV